METRQIERDLMGDIWASPDVWDNLAYLCDQCNGRFAGTEDERRAGDFIMARLKDYGLANVAAEPFEMRGWERGETHFVLLDGTQKIELPCLALPGTPPCNLEAEVIDLGQGTPADFERAGEAARGKIVLTSSDGPGRGEKYQSAIEAGAVAFIFANAQPGMLAPTGSIGKELPAIGMAYEPASRILRILGKDSQRPDALRESFHLARAHLTTTSQPRQVTARNIVGEIPGTDPTQGWILAGGHYDGHDIAQGAHDNAAAIAVLMEAARLLSPLREHLKVGIRFVAFSGEELGLFGSYAYAHAHSIQADQIRVMFNVDVVGAAMPLVLQMQASPELAAYFRGLPLAELDAVVNDGPRSFIMNSDHFPFSLQGISAVWAVTSHPASGHGWGHTSADTLDKVEPRLLRQTASTITRLLLRMASDPQNLPTGRKSPQQIQQILSEAGFEKSLRASGKWSS